ncbi:MAG: OmpH family outer membrane protein [Deltaproteobacteria bacterium]|jgi:outer membrane protein|nr:OmpH family outer membrane protein [Deltaproteobacteria bacterium]
MRAYKIACVIWCLIIIFFSNFSLAADVAKIGVIDFQKVLEISAAGKAIQAELKKKNEKMTADLQKKGAEIEKIQRRLERESMVMSKEMREDKEREQRIKVNDFKTLQKKYRSELQKVQVKLMQQLQTDVTTITREIGKKEGYLLIMDKRGVIYTPRSVDLSDKLIRQLNTKFAKTKK